MYFYPGKQKTFSRIFNHVRKEAFFDRQLDLFFSSEGDIYQMRMNLNGEGFSTCNASTTASKFPSGTI